MQTVQERNMRLAENELWLQDEIRELKRQVAIRDDRVAQLGGEGFQTISYKRKTVGDNASVKDISRNEQTAEKERSDKGGESADADLIYIDTYQ